MGTYDVVCDTFVTIVQDVGFHMGREQLHVFCFNHVQFISLMSQHSAHQR